MENRSFDHVLGWLPEANGRQAGLSYVDKGGATHTTWPLGPDFQGCAYEDPDHTWPGIATQYADGRCDGFLQTAKVGDKFPIGYYREDELPILSAVAKGYTTFDNYFCSMMGPTWENRLFQLTGTTQLDEGWCDFPKEGERRPVVIPTAIFDRVREAGFTAGYYYHESPVTGLFASRRYDDISNPIEQFWRDARDGKLANVVFVDPNYTDRAEDMGTSNDYHPWGNLLVAEGFLAQVHDALKNSPQWSRMVFVLNFDEHGGFYDHVPPPECQDDTKLGGAGPFPNLNPKHAAESTERTAGASRERRLHMRLDPLFGLVGSIDVDTGRAIIELAAAGGGHVRSSCSKVTSRWKSATRREISSGPISSRR
jgi:phospholipase C